MSPLRAAGIVLGVQAFLVGVYVFVEHHRAAPEARPFAVERLDESAPTLSAAHDEQPAVMPDAPHLVHFWATWCAPCQEELSTLLEATSAASVPLLAVTDEPWVVVERYFDGDVPAAIVRDTTSEAAKTWRVSGLPDTFVVRKGRIIGRMGGPREWGSTEARDFLRELHRAR